MLAGDPMNGGLKSKNVVHKYETNSCLMRRKHSREHYAAVNDMLVSAVTPVPDTAPDLDSEMGPGTLSNVCVE